MHAPSAASANNHVESGFRLGELTVDPKAGEVAGPGGTEKLDPKVMDVLVMLAEHAGQVVPREELLAQLWPNVVVTDEVLSRCIYDLRRQLSLAAGSDDLRTLIETLPKRGYRLNADVTPIGPRARRRSASGPLLETCRGSSLVVAVARGALDSRGRSEHARPTASTPIAVLPFDDMSEAQDQAYLADGFAEEILDRLNQSTDLRVIARTSSFSLRDSGTGCRGDRRAS